MSFFHRKRKQKFLITDPYLVRFELASDFTPENNSQIKQILDDVSKVQKENHETPLSETLPFASFKTAEDFFDQLRSVAAQNAQPINFDYFAVWTYDTNEPTKIGKPSSGDGNPHELITMNREDHQFTINSEYQNMTVQLFEVIFNDPDNADFSYEDKLDYCKKLREAYLNSTQLDESQIASLPSMNEANKGNVKLSIPSLSHPEVAVKEAENNNAAPVYDPTSHTFSTPATTNNEQPTSAKAASQAEAPQSTTINDQGVRTFDTPTNVTNEARETTQSAEHQPKRERRTMRKSVEDEAQEQTDLARTKGHIDAPQFAVSVLDPVEPGHKGYVEYQLNQRMKTYNTILKKMGKQISSKNEKAIINVRQTFSKQVDQAIQEFDKKHEHDDDKLFANIQNDMKDKANDKIKEANDVVDLKTQKLKDQAKQSYDSQINEINHQAEKEKIDNENNIMQSFTNKAQDIFSDQLAEHDQKLQKSKDELVHKLNLKYELESREQAAQLRADGDKILQEAFRKMNDNLDNLKSQTIRENNSAKEVNISQQRVENEKQRLEAPFKDLQQAQSKIQAMQDRLSTATAERDQYKKQLTDQEALLHESSHKMEAMQERINTLTTKQANDKVSKSNNDSVELLNKLVTLQVAQAMGKPKTITAEQSEQQPDQPVEAAPANNNSNMNLMMKGFKRLTFVLIVVIVALLALGGWGFVHQQRAYSQQLTNNTKLMNAKLAKARQANQPISQKEADQKALIALHENSLSKLNKYSNEQYYNLDKAIVENNASAAQSAVQGMGNNLHMNDHYRAAQAQNLLTKAGNNSLAKKVGDAN